MSCEWPRLQSASVNFIFFCVAALSFFLRVFPPFPSARQHPPSARRVGHQLEPTAYSTGVAMRLPSARSEKIEKTKSFNFFCPSRKKSTPTTHARAHVRLLHVRDGKNDSHSPHRVVVGISLTGSSCACLHDDNDPGDTNTTVVTRVTTAVLQSSTAKRKRGHPPIADEEEEGENSNHHDG